MSVLSYQEEENDTNMNLYEFVCGCESAGKSTGPPGGHPLNNWCFECFTVQAYQPSRGIINSPVVKNIFLVIYCLYLVAESREMTGI